MKACHPDKRRWVERCMPILTPWQDYSDVDAFPEAEQPRLDEFLKVVIFGLATLLAYRFGSPSILEPPGVLSLPVSVLLCALLVAPIRRWWIYLAVSACMCIVVGL